ncbi:MAG: acylphosphatase [Rhodospirillales bacterium]
MTRIVRRALISGKVQGVWFRAWTVTEAEKLGLDGWVRNLRDGRVEALIAGAETAVDSLLARLAEGPPLAKVEAVAVRESAEEPPVGFHQRDSA